MAWHCSTNIGQGQHWYVQIPLRGGGSELLGWLTPPGKLLEVNDHTDSSGGFSSSVKARVQVLSLFSPFAEWEE